MNQQMCTPLHPILVSFAQKHCISQKEKNIEKKTLSSDLERGVKGLMKHNHIGPIITGVQASIHLWHALKKCMVIGPIKYYQKINGIYGFIQVVNINLKYLVPKVIASLMQGYIISKYYKLPYLVRCAQGYPQSSLHHKTEWVKITYKFWCNMVHLYFNVLLCPILLYQWSA